MSGLVECTITGDDKQIYLTIADDGRGIDPGAIRTKVIAHGMLKQEEISELSDQEVLLLIFKDGFSTKEVVSELSGRGVGLAAVQSELAKLGGTMNVKSEPGEGTEFHFSLPLNDEEIWGVSVFELMNPLIETAKKHIEEQTGVSINSMEGFNIYQAKKLELHKATAIITIRGSFECSFILSLDEDLLKTIVHNVVLDPLTAEEENEYMEDVLTETTDIILGNSLKLFPGLEELLLLSIRLSRGFYLYSH